MLKKEIDRHRRQKQWETEGIYVLSEDLTFIFTAFIKCIFQ